MKTATAETVIWVLQGEQADRWMSGRVEIPPQTTNFQVMNAIILLSQYLSFLIHQVII